MLIAALGMVLLTRITLHASYLTAIVPALVLLGFGIGLVFGTAMNIGTAGATEADAGVASAMINTSQQIGGSIGTALLNSLAASATATYLLHRTSTALTRITLDADYLTAIVPALVFLGAGIGLVFGTALNVGTLGATEADAGIASAVISTSQQIGGSIGTALLNSLAASATANYLLHRTSTALARNHGALHGDIVVFTVVAAILAAGAVVAALVYPNGKVAVDPNAATVRVG